MDGGGSLGIQDVDEAAESPLIPILRKFSKPGPKKQENLHFLEWLQEVGGSGFCWEFLVGIRGVVTLGSC